MPEPYPGGDRVLYVLDCAGIPVGPVTGVSPFAVQVVTLYRPTHSSEGGAAQCGVFTLHPNPTAGFEAEGLEWWLIEADVLTGICMTVDGYGTDDEALTYADLGFMCRKLNWDWEVRILADSGEVRARR